MRTYRGGNRTDRLGGNCLTGSDRSGLGPRWTDAPRNRTSIAAARHPQDLPGGKNSPANTPVHRVYCAHDRVYRLPWFSLRSRGGSNIVGFINLQSTAGRTSNFASNFAGSTRPSLRPSRFSQAANCSRGRGAPLHRSFDVGRRDRGANGPFCWHRSVPPAADHAQTKHPQYSKINPVLRAKGFQHRASFSAEAPNHATS